MDLANIWTVWPIPSPWKLSPMVGGTRNQVWRVDAEDGQSYILRLSPNVTRIPDIHYEAVILQALSDKCLPFRLPLLLKTKNNEFTVLVEQDTGMLACATLYPFLPGYLPEHDLFSVSCAGSALAQLDNALATLFKIRRPDGFIPPPSIGELTCSHPLVPDPLRAVERLPVDRDQANHIYALLSAVIEGIPSLYRQLPQQLLHRDCGTKNILINRDCVTAILDFEDMGEDIRVLDICTALSWWLMKLLGTGKEWDMLDAFGRAYTRHIALGEDELSMIPDVWRLRLAYLFVYKMGCYLSSPNSRIDIQNQIKRLLWTDTWLSSHRETLLSHILTWN